MKEKIRECFERLQTVTIQATVSNMEAMLQTLYELREIYNEEADHEADPE